MNIEIAPNDYVKELNYHDALLYCQLLVIDGKNDWRLPTSEELEYIDYNYDRTSRVDKEFWADDMTNIGFSTYTYAEKAYWSGYPSFHFPTANAVYVLPVRTC